MTLKREEVESNSARRRGQALEVTDQTRRREWGLRAKAWIRMKEEASSVARKRVGLVKAELTSRNSGTSCIGISPVDNFCANPTNFSGSDEDVRPMIAPSL
ncbi:BQ5605_C020g09170 [Microbotryum silenes-dioicae]|uniref:BQ5605_C020g09170 protein n=1 Tax=Microbotryum silenes-dioicae TaxID=796604 RepID=A0A2X0PDT8_9BASI|nr:BQ5605_C020g09170 [Microbotryum silenes-dioicae]